jgi:hypothetical protein
MEDRMRTRIWGAAFAQTGVAALLAWSPSAAQSPSARATSAPGAARDACSLLTAGEVEKLINRGRPTYGQEATATTVGGGAGSVCDYPVGAQVVWFPGPKSQAGFEAFLKAWKRDKEARHPVAGVGDRAWIMFPTPRDQYEDKVAYLVTAVGQHTVAVHLAAKKGAADGPMMEYCKRGQLSKKECDQIENDKSETAESLQPAVVELAKAVVAKLK